MKFATTMIAIAALITGTATVSAGTMSKRTSGDQITRGASSYTPGHRMQAKGTHGASAYTPGHRMQAKGTRGASAYTPGHRMQAKKSMGQPTTTGSGGSSR